jgi:hypothetical protein
MSFSSSFWAIALIASLAPARAAETSTTTPAAKQAIADGVGAILSGDGARARATLAAIPAADFAQADRTSRACIIARLEGRDTVIEPAVKARFVRRLLRVYRRYWSTVELARPADRPSAERELIIGLRGLIGKAAPRDVSGLEPLITERFSKAGCHGLKGVTPPFRELMLWAREDEHDYDVDLPDGKQAVRVVFINDFVSGGWSSYLSCGRTGTGGWTTSKAIYAVRPDPDSEDFRVSLLAHEGQHFWDKTHLSEMKPWELEYRAKLVGLARADTIREKLVHAFEANQSDDPASSHGYADRKLLATLRRRLGLPADGDLLTAPRPAVQAAALAELKADTAARTTTVPS